MQCIPRLAWLSLAAAFIPAAFAGDPDVPVVLGRVVDTVMDAPLAGATVRVEGGDLAATTDEHGAFRIEGVAPGAAQITVVKDGYVGSNVPVSFQVAPTGATSLQDVRLTLDLPKPGVYTVAGDKVLQLAAAPTVKVSTDTSGSRPVDVLAVRGLPSERMPHFATPTWLAVKAAASGSRSLSIVPLQPTGAAESWVTVLGHASTTEVRRAGGMEVLRPALDDAGPYALREVAGGTTTLYPFWVDQPPHLTLPPIEEASDKHPAFAGAVAALRTYCGSAVAGREHVCRDTAPFLAEGAPVNGVLSFPSHGPNGELLLRLPGNAKAVLVECYPLGNGAWNVADIEVADAATLEVQ